MKEHLAILDFEAIVNNGNLVPLDKERFLAETKNGERLRLRVIQSTEKPSKEQHGYFGFLCTWLTKNTEQFAGWTPKQVRSFAKAMFLSEAVSYHYQGKVLEFYEIPSLGEVSKQRFREFMESWLAHLSSEGIEAPPPKFVNTDPFYVDDSALYTSAFNDEYEPGKKE